MTINDTYYNGGHWVDGMDLEMFPFLWCKVLRGENYGGLGGESLVP